MDNREKFTENEHLIPCLSQVFFHLTANTLVPNANSSLAKRKLEVNKLGDFISSSFCKNEIFGYICLYKIFKIKPFIKY